MSPTAHTSRLHDLLADRAQWVTGHRNRRPHEATTHGSRAIVVLSTLDLVDLVQGARTFAHGLGSSEARDWRESWTRTRFLFGNPVNLTCGEPPRVTAPHRTASWFGPLAATHQPASARLLKPASGTLPTMPERVQVPGTGRCRDLTMVTAGAGLVDYLVHLHHTVAEAVLRERLLPHEPIQIIHHRTWAPLPHGVDPAYARVLPHPESADSLRLHAWLSQ